MTDITKKTKLKRIRIHDFRHSYASMLISKGVDVYTVSKMLGHADIKTTINVYGHLYPDKRKEITNLFADEKGVKSKLKK